MLLFYCNSRDTHPPPLPGPFFQFKILNSTNGSVYTVLYSTLKVDGNEKWGGSERWHWLGISLGLRRSMAISNLNIQLLYKKHIYFSACSSIINRRCLDKFYLFDPLCLFKMWKLTKAERTRQRQYIGGIIVYILNRQGGTNFADFLGDSHHIAYSRSKLDAPIYWRCKS